MALAVVLTLAVVGLLTLSGIVFWKRDALFGSDNTTAAATSEPAGDAASFAESTGGSGGSGSSGDATADDDAAAPASSSSRLVLNTGGDADYINISSLQKWVDDVNNGDLDALTRKCWTFPASYIKEFYLGHTDRVAAVLAQTPGGAQTGISWGDFSGGDEVFVTWAEGDSSYACPRIDLDGVDPLIDDRIAHNVKRLILRAQGNPINPTDTPENYPGLICDRVVGETNTDVHNLDQADPNDIDITNSNYTDHLDSWTGRSGDVSLSGESSFGTPCVMESN